MHASVCDFVSDLAQNAIEAGAKGIIVELREEGGRIEASVADDGKGMDEATLKQCTDPFQTDGVKHARRKVGLGLPFVQQAAEQAGGSFDIQSEEGMGTSVFFAFDAANVDTPPRGDVPGTVAGLMNYPGGHELVFVRSAGGRSYRISREEVRAALGGVETAEDLGVLEEYTASLEEELMNQR